jgi:predicted HicB family RNase H-like nuclease
MIIRKEVIEMKQFLFHVPDEVHAAVKSKAALSGKKMKDWLLDAIKSQLGKPE